MLLVNTWRTKRTPWLVKYVDADAKVPAEVAARVRELVLELPVRINIPLRANTASLPRFYAIIYNESRIYEIVGVRRSLIPMRWSYRLGYWHPRCQLEIARALEEYVAEVGGR